jgi:D-alanine-D-alanine ligase
MILLMKRKIALITGGDSGEIEISLQSALEVKKHLKDRFDVYTIFIRQDKWVHVEEVGSVDGIPVDKNDFSIVKGRKKITFDCVFIALHGTPGEDGKLQGYFDMLGIPYTTCGRTTTAMTFNKYFSNRIVRALGIHTAEAIFIPSGELFDPGEIIKKLGLPCFVKPNNNGSSVGISKVNDENDLQVAIDKAFMEDDEVVVDSFIDGYELTCGVFKYLNEMFVLPLTKVVSKKDFFDYEAKYSDGMADEITPAPVPESIEIDCKRTSAFLYNELNCKGLVRFDYIVDEDKLYFLEVNTIPGMTKNSIVPKMAGVMGIALGDLYAMLVEDAVYRHIGT